MPPPLVVDASLVFRLLVPNPQQHALRAQVDAWQQGGVALAAPTLWLYELTSAIAKGIHAGQIVEEEGRGLVALVHTFPVDLMAPDVVLGQAALAWSRRLQRANAYDSAYLALAEALHADLWTADRRLANAVSLDWVRYVG
jgi:predicted nucleic acid-binding protein